jgi:molecular chaperone DnaK
VRDASSHEAEDRKKAEIVDLRNRADQQAYQTERTAKEHEAVLPAELREEATAVIAETRRVLTEKPNDRAAIEAQLAKLDQVNKRLSDEMSKQAAAASATAGSAQARPGGPGPREPGGDGRSRSGRASTTREAEKPEDVIDADYKVVDETKPD